MQHFMFVDKLIVCGAHFLVGMVLLKVPFFAGFRWVKLVGLPKMDGDTLNMTSDLWVQTGTPILTQTRSLGS